MNPLEISDSNCEQMRSSGPLTPPVFNNRSSLLSQRKLTEKLANNLEAVSDDDMSSELSVADEVERREDTQEESKEPQWLQMNDSRRKTVTKELDKSNRGTSPSHANLSKLMAKLDDQSVSAVYGTSGINSLPNVNPYQNTNTVFTT